MYLRQLNIITLTKPSIFIIPIFRLTLLANHMEKETLYLIEVMNRVKTRADSQSEDLGFSSNSITHSAVRLQAKTLTLSKPLIPGCKMVNICFVHLPGCLESCPCCRTEVAYVWEAPLWGNLSLPEKSIPVFKNYLLGSGRLPKFCHFKIPTSCF